MEARCEFRKNRNKLIAGKAVFRSFEKFPDKPFLKPIPLYVKFRLFINTFNEELREFEVPRFEGIDRGDVAEGTLGDVMVIGEDVMVQSGVKLGRGGKASLLNDLIDGAIKAFNHAIGLRVSRSDEAMLDVKEETLFVKGVLTGGMVLLAGETVGELRAVVGQ